MSELLLPQQQQEKEHDQAPSQHDRKKRRRKQKNNEKDDHAEMLIFGYEARIFNDKNVAEKVEKGHYLIPWQSCDTRYMMDRYDVRHMLEDLEKELSQYDSKQQHNNKDEDLCKQERYEDLDSEEEVLFDMSEDERDEYVGKYM